MADEVVVVAVAVPADGQAAAVRAALRAAVAAVHDEPGCERYALHEREDGAFVMIERWADAAALDAHDAGQALRVLGPALQGRLARPIDVTRMRPVPAGDASRGSL